VAFIANLIKIMGDMLPSQHAQEAAFDSAEWIVHWLQNTQQALGGNTPNQFLKETERRAIVLRLAYESGAYV
jgi:hypothetical protein